MPIFVTCACARTFAVKDSLAGKRVKCPGCRQPVHVPPPSEDLDPLTGLNDLDLDELKSLPSLAPLRKKTKSTGQHCSQSSSRTTDATWRAAFTPKVIGGISAACIVALAFIVGLMNPIIWLGLLLIFLLVGLAGSIVAVVGGIGMLMAAFEEDSTTGILYLLVPFYPLYFMISRWDDMSSPKITAAGIGMTIASPLLISGLIAITPKPTTHDLTRWEGRPAPDLTITTTDGSRLKISDLHGRGVIVDCWATWCGPCLREIPHLERVADDFPKDLVVVGISSEELQTVQRFASSRVIRYRVGTADSPPPPFAPIAAVPTTFFIDRQGVIRKVLVGYRDYPALREQASLLVQ